MDAKEQLARAMTETEWQTQVQQMLDLGGWTWFHAPDNLPRRSRRGTVYVQDVRAGFPDLIALRGRQLLVAELKQVGKRPTAQQAMWLGLFRHVTPLVFVWTPLDRDEARKVLTERPAPSRD